MLEFIKREEICILFFLFFFLESCYAGRHRRRRVDNKFQGPFKGEIRSQKTMI